MSDNQLLKALSDYDEKTVNEYDEAVTQIELRDTEIAVHEEKAREIEHVLKSQHEALLKTQDDKKIFLANEDSLKKQSVAFQIEAKTLEHKLSVLKKEAKASKEQTIRNKKAIAARDVQIKKLEKAVPSKKENAKMPELNCIYSKGKDVLLVYPSKLTLGINGVKTDQAVLLFTNREGCFVTAFLDENQEVAYSDFIDDDAKVSDQTKRLIKKNCMKVSEGANSFAQSWLYKVNVMQKSVVEPIDLTCHRD